MKKMEISPEIRALARRIREVKEQQRLGGLFCEDREPLSGPRCGLEEDITSEGFLIVSSRSNSGVDTRLRFSVVGVEKGRYRCTGCGKEVAVPESGA